MSRHRRTARALAATAALSLVSACVVSVSLELTQAYAVEADKAGPVSVPREVNLQDVAEIREHRGTIRSLDLDSIVATIGDIGPANAATRLDGSIKLRRVLGDPSNDIVVGEVSNLPVVLGQTLRMPGNAQLDAFLMDRLDDEGTFWVIFDGAVDGAADVRVDLQLHASLGYDTGVF